MIGSEIWGVVEGVMGYRIAYLERWLPELTAFSDFRCPGPAPDLLSQILDQDLGAGQLPVQLTQASRPEVGLGLGCRRLIQILGKDFSALLPLLRGLNFFFKSGQSLLLGLCLGSLLLSLIMPTLFDWEASRGGGTIENTICLSKLQRKFSIGLLFFQ